MSTRWSDEDLKFLTQNYGKKHISEISKCLGRSEAAVYNKSCALKLINTKYFVIKEKLVELYINKKLSAIDIAKSYNVHYSKIYWLLKKYNIPRRTLLESASNVNWDNHIRKMKTYCSIPYDYYNSIKRASIKRKLDFSISIEYAWSIFLKQNKLCVFSGRELIFITRTKDTKLQTASLDRIDSSKGYVEGNIQWIHKDLQSMKMNKSDDEFIKLCNLVAKYRSAI